MIRSLPVPPSSVIVSSDSAEVENKVTQENIEKKVLHKLLLVGSIKSGSSTIFKQVGCCCRKLLSYIYVLLGYV